MAEVLTHLPCPRCMACHSRGLRLHIPTPYLPYTLYTQCVVLRLANICRSAQIVSALHYLCGWQAELLDGSSGMIDSDKPDSSPDFSAREATTPSGVQAAQAFVPHTAVKVCAHDTSMKRRCRCCVNSAGTHLPCCCHAMHKFSCAGFFVLELSYEATLADLRLHMALILQESLGCCWL